ncbi:CDP-glucose 4,6-dehydratase [Leptospira kobayashii]|uniref:CDP-glucose 4,6-dehydratase n=1 Tax=Leptospira kobayashii TaxID=1917830 RepID=A0ABM7UJW9_9LEPT|nr:CDP-glucose 4,6-dehydratase [Leptospira kobayashii]
MEGLDLNKSFWKGKSVFLTGHTGFKGSWLSLWLSSLGAKVTGYSLEPPTNPSLFVIASVQSAIEKSVIADIRDLARLQDAMRAAKPDIVIHMAAQPLVRDSYKIPVDTYSINVMGTVHILEAIRTDGPNVKAFVNVTTDKVYENKEWSWGYRENETLGGYDPYSNSKACSELVTSAYRNSFFHPEKIKEHGVAIATARAGNVIGGGDFALDRLIPDIIRSIMENKKLSIRNPNSIRPWQHVLEPLSGYMELAEGLYNHDTKFIDGWNFGPNEGDAKSVLSIVEILNQKISENGKEKKSPLHFPGFEIDKGPHPHEANYLKLDISKARSILGWSPRWNLDTALGKIIEWTESYLNKEKIDSVCIRQIGEYMSASGQ